MPCARLRFSSAHARIKLREGMPTVPNSFHVPTSSTVTAPSSVCASRSRTPTAMLVGSESPATLSISTL